jgi:hypothetical protein
MSPRVEHLVKLIRNSGRTAIFTIRGRRHAALRISTNGSPTPDALFEHQADDTDQAMFACATDAAFSLGLIRRPG